MIFNVGAGGGASTADKVKYDNTESGLQSDNVQGAVDELNSSLTANSNQFYFDYQDGKYGFNTDPNRGADTFIPFSSTVYLRSVLRYNSRLSDSQKFSAEVQLSTDNSTWTTVAICYAAFGSSATSDVYTYK